MVNPNADPNPLDLAGGSQEVLFTCGIIDPSGSLYLNVVINLTSLLGNADQRMYDDGTNGDAVAGDGIYSYRYIVPVSSGSGFHNLVITATNAYGQGSGEAVLEITVPGEFVWDGGGVDSNWSTPENWSTDTVPVPGDKVAFNHTSSAECVVDVIANNLTSITLGPGFNGTVTFIPHCVDGVSNELTLIEDLTIHSGTVIFQGDPTAINEASGGTEANPHGAGIIINAANITLASGAKISADSQGFGANEGPGVGSVSGDQGAGGSYGGYGGAGASAPYGFTYGSLSSPTALGSGGARDTYGGKGGGAIKLNAPTGTVTINGTVSANGHNYTGTRAGGGSGGSIWIIADTLEGGGAITAEGRNGVSGYGGGGSGGRIALEWGTRSFSGTISARGGTGRNYGHYGTIWVPAGKWNELWNSTYHVNGSVALVPGTYDIDELYVDSGVTLECQGDDDGDPVDGTGVTINSNAITVEGAISAAGLGFRSNKGPGIGSISGSNGAGGSYGGYGGAGASAPHGSTYGSLSSPTSLGSGGAYSDYGGDGGGAIKLNVPTGTVTINGTVSANGYSLIGSRAGGGSGGSVWIIADTLEGGGAITAEGRNGENTYGGGGSGGRIALEWGTRSFSGTISARGGTGRNYGHYGTIWVPAGKWNELWNSTYHVNGSVALVPGTYDIDELYVDSGVTLECQGDDDGDPVDGTGVTINSNAITVEGTISAAGLGFLSNEGPGKGASWSNRGSGGSYGGYGGDGQNALHGSIYGSVSEPLALGSGGAYSVYGGPGGGAVKLNAPTGTVTINGTVSANGYGYFGGYSGGGSGGSVLIIADTLAGAGVITANGGNSNGSYGGGGGGGRVAGYFSHNSSLIPERTTVFGGTGLNNGEPGTVAWSPIGGYIEDNVIPLSQCVQGAGGNVTITFKAKDPGNWVNGIYSGTEETVTEVIVNDSEATFYNGTNDWIYYASGYNGDLYYAVTDAGGKYVSTCTWTPDIPVAGDYRVYAWWTPHSNRATDAPYTINYNGGSDTVDVNQEINGNQWNYLGTYNFTAGTSGTVVLTNDANEYVIADAVRFVLDIENPDTDSYTLYDFEYSVNDGSDFNAPLNGDSSGCLSPGWQDNSGSNYTTGETYGVASAYSFTWDTLHPEMAGDLTGVLNNNVQIRFKVRNTVTQDVDTYYIDSRESLTSESFTVDNQ